MKEEIFKPGADVVCINDELFGWDINGLSKGKIYNVISIMYEVDNSVVIHIMDDLGDISFYNSNRFMPLQLYRSKILESILK